jgi:hypothetical protein
VPTVANRTSTTSYRLLTLTLAAVLALPDRASAEAYVINRASNFQRVGGVNPDDGSMPIGRALLRSWMPRPRR